ncbi:MAG TPA: hypothetical protein VK783_09025 [Bacteroidia bacterium]|jgi:hypothetical protein|nr:hypothetical protein [Bacteroidia bacterium]
MRITLLAFFTLFSLQCFSQQSTDSVRVNPNNRPGPSAIGTVVHIDNKNCPVAIRVIHPERKDTLYYIPIGTDIDSLMGKRITFRFGKLMIKQPLGCTGIVARVWDVRKVNATHKKSRKSN